MTSLLARFESNRPFKADEAWLLFRSAAFGEAIGWTLLISGLLIKRYLMHGNNDAVLIAGQIHGMLFFCYAAASLGLYPSLGWSRKKAIVATLASVPPYGSLLFEQWAAYARSHQALQRYKMTALYTRVLCFAAEQDYQ